MGIEAITVLSAGGSGWRAGVAVVALFLVLGFYRAPDASAAITFPGAPGVAAGVANDPSQVTSASFETQPPNSTTAGLATTVHAPFPTHGSSYGILSTGDAAAADEANDSGSTGTGFGGGNVRGDSDFDVTITKIDLAVPSGTNCLGIDFRFLSEEFPEFVGSTVNDAFIAELDASTWTTSSSEISAPGNFAFDESAAVISVNSTSGVTAENAAGTTYDGATPVLRAETPVAPGTHSVYLSIFDQGDDIYDSAVFVDNLRAFATADCMAGAAPPSDDPPPPEPPAPLADPTPPEPPADPLVSGPPPEPSPIETLDEPVVGENFNAAAVDGKVKRKCDDDRKFVRLKSAEQLPVGCTLDTRNGTVLLVSSTGTDGETRSGEFWDGVFRVSQKARKGKSRKRSRSKNVKTNLALTGSLGCGGKDKRFGDRSGAGLHSPARKRKKGNGLWARGGGGHRTKGNRGSGTVRGTTWRTVDRCDGSTLFKVTDGEVEVDDFAKKKDVILEAGERYIAKRSRRR